MGELTLTILHLSCWAAMDILALAAGFQMVNRSMICRTTQYNRPIDLKRLSSFLQRRQERAEILDIDAQVISLDAI